MLIGHAYLKGSVTEQGVGLLYLTWALVSAATYCGISAILDCLQSVLSNKSCEILAI